jgi:hypothetical protein
VTIRTRAALIGLSLVCSTSLCLNLWTLNQLRMDDHRNEYRLAEFANETADALGEALTEVEQDEVNGLLVYSSLSRADSYADAARLLSIGMRDIDRADFALSYLS